MNRIISVFGAVGVGMALMYLLDPDRGARRRALIRDKAVGLSNDVSDAVRRTSQDLSNRAQGLMHEARSRMPASSSGQASQPQQQQDNVNPPNMAIG